MESANSHHQLQDQLVGSSAAASSSSSSSLPTTINPSLYGFTTSQHASWPPSSFLNSSNCWSSYPIETKQQQQQQQQQSQLYSSHPGMGPDQLSFNCNWGIHNHNSDQEESCRIKEELADHYYRNFSQILSSHDNNNLQPRNNDDVDATKFLLKSLSSYAKIPPDFYSSSFVNPTPGSLDMNLEALDLLASSRFTSSHNQNIGILRDGFSNYSFDHHQIPFYASNKVSSASSINVAAADTKRNSTKMEPKSLIQKPPKKSRLEARSSCPPFKVRKEKLGDRIAALQQLVAPFGKTDTASVLMEAIGYIKFLQSQVETLSVPYMKASRNRVIKGMQQQHGPVENENEETKRDLKSRGLCLVPLSCLSYITDGGGAAVWPPPHFGGAT